MVFEGQGVMKDGTNRPFPANRGYEPGAGEAVPARVTFLACARM
jgi:hypothetical protein